MKKDLAKELYRSFRSHNRRNPQSNTEEIRERVADPQKIDVVLNELIINRDWRKGIAEGSLFTQWQVVVGENIASHTTPISLVDGRLTVQSSSTAWATQLTLISSQLLGTIRTTAPGALVEELVIIGPHAPSWKKGIRSIKGARGPRDTYN
jgi:predicted nucleic acid-binding Zn ribbon protein